MSPHTKTAKKSVAAAPKTTGPADNDDGPSWPLIADLGARIRERIESRIGERIKDLSVEVTGGRVRLGGRCSTYYSKQLAQHAALGVIEDEQLDNLIQVGPRP